MGDVVRTMALVLIGAFLVFMLSALVGTLIGVVAQIFIMPLAIVAGWYWCKYVIYKKDRQ